MNLERRGVGADKTDSADGVSSAATISTEDIKMHIDIYGKVREPDTKHYFKLEGTKVVA